jgi:hypothetical protein
MTTYCTRIWASIRTCAGDALKAFRKHRVWHQPLVDPNFGVVSIRNTALNDVAVPAEVDAFLRELAGAEDERTGERLLRAWPTVHTLEGLDLIARSESRNEALAERPKPPDRRFLYGWAIGEETLFEAMRRGGADSDPDSLLADMYAAEPDVMVRDLIASCGFSAEAW